MQTRQAKRLRDLLETDDDDTPLSSIFSKQTKPNIQPQETETEVHEPPKTSAMTNQGTSSKKKEKAKAKVSSKSRHHHRSSEQVKPSSNLSENFFRGLNFESRYKTSIISKTQVYEKLMDLFFYQNSPLKACFESSGIASIVFPPSTTYPRLIQQFYTNFENKGDSYSSFVKGKSIEFTVTELGNILSIPSSGLWHLPIYVKRGSLSSFFPVRAVTNIVR